MVLPPLLSRSQVLTSLFWCQMGGISIVKVILQWCKVWVQAFSGILEQVLVQVELSTGLEPKCHILNSSWIHKVLPSHSRVISAWSLSHPQVLPSTLKYSRVSRVKPKLVHLPPYTWIICIPPSLAPSLLQDFGIPALYYSLYTLYTLNWHTSDFPSFQVHIPFRLLYILVPLLTPFGSSDLRFLQGSVTPTWHSRSSGTLPQNLVPLVFPWFSL